MTLHQMLSEMVSPNAIFEGVAFVNFMRALHMFHDSLSIITGILS